jgi:hypothetical protein
MTMSDDVCMMILCWVGLLVDHSSDNKQAKAFNHIAITQFIIP